MAMAALNNISQYEKAGMIKILGTNTIVRSALAPEIPSTSTVAPNLDLPGQIGLLGPAGMPKEVIEKLARALDNADKAPEVIAALKTLGVEPAASRAPDELAQRIQSDRVKYGTLIKSMGLVLE